MNAARRALVLGSPLLALLLVGGVVFARLVARPSAILVDPDRPSLDRAMPADAVAVGNDLTRLFLPYHLRIASALRSLGHVPSWDPLGFGGRPYVGNPQAGLRYPPTWLAWKIWTPATLGWVTIGHLIWGGLGIYALMRAERIGRFAATTSATCWGYAPYVLAQVYEGHYPHLWGVSWYAWTFWAAIGLSRGEARGWLVPPFLAMGLLAGHPQEAFYLILALGGFLGSWVLREGRSNRLSAGRMGWVVVLVGTMTLGMIAIEFVPDLLIQPHLLRGAKLTFREASKYHVNNLNLMQMLSPRALGGPADYFGPGGYVEPLMALGWVPLVLVGVAVARSPRRGMVLGWGLLVVFATWFAWGPRLGLFRLIYAAVPGMDRFRVPARALFLATTGAAVLAGLGVEAIRERGIGLGFVRVYLGIALLILAVLGLSRMIDPGAALESDRSIWLRAASRVLVDPIFLAAIVGTAIGLVWLGKRPQDRGRVAIGLGLLAMAELAGYGHDLIRVSPPSKFLESGEVDRAIAAIRPAEPFRIRARDAAFTDLNAEVLGLEKTNVNETFQIQHAADIYEVLYPMFGSEGPPRFAHLQTPEVQESVLERMNVAMIVTDRDDPRIDWPIAVRTSRFVIRRNPDPLPRAYVVPHAEVVAPSPTLVARFPTRPAREFVFLASDPLNAYVGPRQAFRPADYSAEDPDRVEVRVTTEAPGYLVVADTWMPGWSAEVDGRASEILEGNRCQRVIPLPDAGAHRIVMRFDPPGWAIGRGITLTTLIAWAIGFAAWSSRRRRRVVGAATGGAG